MPLRCASLAIAALPQGVVVCLSDVNRSRLHRIELVVWWNEPLGLWNGVASPLYVGDPGDAAPS